MSAPSSVVFLNFLYYFLTDVLHNRPALNACRREDKTANDSALKYSQLVGKEGVGKEGEGVTCRVKQTPFPPSPPPTRGRGGRGRMLTSQPELPFSVLYLA
jgi:hypothetical protein